MKTMFRIRNIVPAGSGHRYCSGCSSFLLGGHTDFDTMIRHGKRMARRMLIIEDRTSNLGSIWFQDDQTLNQRLFGDSSGGGKIYRWRIGSNGSLAGGQLSKRFLLVQFETGEHLDDAINHLQSRYRTTVFNQLGLLTDNQLSRGDFPVPPSTPVKDLRLKVFVGCEDDQPRLNRYRLMSADGTGGRLVAEFEDHLTSMAKRRPTTSANNKTVVQKMLQGEPLITSFQHKLRFFICHQIEESLRAHSWSFLAHRKQQNRYRNNHPDLTDKFELVPFGSDVCGFGTNDSDLDLCLVEIGSGDGEKKVRTYRSTRILGSVSSTLESSIKFDNIFLRNYTNVARIFRAFVPIIKFRARLMPTMNIDLSVDTECNSGVQMARYLYHCSHRTANANQIRTFVMVLKTWARYHGLIQSNPGEWFSSFQMTMLAIAYLQHRHLIPTVSRWWPSRQRTHQLPSEAPVETQSIDDLMRGFLHFVINEFDFWKNAMDIRSGEMAMPKPVHTKHHSPCYVVNPFLPHLNITKTVSESELERFLSYGKQTLEVMERVDFHTSHLFRPLDDRLQNVRSF